MKLTPWEKPGRQGAGKTAEHSEAGEESAGPAAHIKNSAC